MTKAKLATWSAVLVLGLLACELRASDVAEPSSPFLAKPPRPQLPPGTKSILLISIDTLRADHLSTYGYFRDTDPNLKRFADKALIFERAYSVMGTTLPAHISLLTSTYPISHAIKANLKVLKQPFTGAHGARSLALSLQKAGFATGAVISSAPLKKNTGINAGFDDYYQPESASHSAGTTTRKVLQWLSKRDPDVPFFLWAHYFDPHEPYRPPDAHRIYEGGPEQEAHFDELAILRGPTDDFPRHRNRDGKTLVDIHNLYDGEVHYVDHEIGKLFAGLEKRRLWDELMVVVVADHGQGLAQHRWDSHGRIYDEILKVPLIVKFPASMAIKPARLEHVVSIIDVVPTLVKHLGLPVSADVVAGYEGVDLLEPDDGRAVLAERVSRVRSWESGAKYALVDAAWKYFHLTEHQDALYALSSDPHELHNVIAEHPERAAAMKAELMEYVARDRAPFKPDENARKKKHKQSPLTEVQRQLREELRALGYVD